MSTALHETLDAVVVGGGPAGLSAALALGRQRRRAMVCDIGAPANAVAHAVHGFLGFDGVPPQEVRRAAREQCERYPSLQFQQTEVLAVEPADGRFRVSTADQGVLDARKVILACGRRYELPAIPGAQALFGSRVLHCPFCHGWESRDRSLAVVGGDAHALQTVVLLRRLSDDLTLCTNGPPELEAEQLDQLQSAGVDLHHEPVAEIAAAGKGIELRFADRASMARDLVFLAHTPRNHELIERLGADRTEDGRVQVDETGETSIPGLYAAGDLATSAQVALAVASGAVAGAAASIVMAHEDLAVAA